MTHTVQGSVESQTLDETSKMMRQHVRSPQPSSCRYSTGFGPPHQLVRPLTRGNDVAELNSDLPTRERGAISFADSDQKPLYQYMAGQLLLGRKCHEAQAVK